MSKEVGITTCLFCFAYIGKEDFDVHMIWHDELKRLIEEHK